MEKLKAIYVFCVLFSLAQEIKSQQSIGGVWTAGAEVGFERYQNWGSSFKNNQTFIVVYPRTSQQVASITTWAYTVGRNVRVQGFRHSQAPITISDADQSTKVVILDMRRYMKKMRVGSLKGINGDMKTVIAEPGASMDELLTFLEHNGLGVLMTPIVGEDVTVGGVLAIAGHGASLPARNEKLQGPGYTFGSNSNSIAELKAVVWNNRMGRYDIKTFIRSDPDIAPFLAHNGRAVITEVTLLVGKNYNMRCVSHLDVPGSELFAHPDHAKGLRTFSSYLQEVGRVDAIWYPSTESPWLKLWYVEERKPPTSRVVTGPYNYQFPIALDNPQIPSTVFGPIAYENLARGLTETNSWDIWGPSKNTLLQGNRTATPMVFSGFVVLTSKANVQLVLHEIVEFYLNTLHEYEDQGISPIDQYMKLRLTGLDDPRETFIAGAVTPSLSPLNPVKSRPDFDVGVWMNTLTATRRPHSDEFLRRFEKWAYSRFNGGDALVRPEWSKDYAHSDTQAHSNQEFLHETIPNVFGVEEWNSAISILDKYDPHHVFSNQYLRKLMVPYKGGRGSSRLSFARNAQPTSFGWRKP